MSNDTVIASLQEKIDDLNQQAWEARVNDSPKAFQLSQESVDLARSINYSKGLAEGLRSLGFGYIRLFKNDEAAPLLRESLSLFKSLNDIKGQGVVYEYLGIIERNWGNLGASLELLLKGDALIQQVGSVEIEVTSCYQIGVTYKHLGNHENALDYLYRSLSIAKKSNNALMEAYAINIIGSIYFDNGDYNDALDCYQRGLVIRRESHDKWGEAGSLDNIGFTYLKLNDLDKAIDYCKQSLKITQSTGDKKGEANTLLHLAEILRQAGDIRQASKFSNESLEIRKARGDKRGEAEVLLFLADLHNGRGDTEDHLIFEWLSGALKIADEIKAQDLLSKAYYNLHEYHTQKGNHKESLIQLEAHLQIEKELHKNTINQKISNLEISHKAEVISQRNKELIELNEKIEKANAELKIEASLERVRAVAMGMKEPADMINVCRMISDQLLQLGFEEIRNVQTAIIYPLKHEYLNYQYFTPYDKESIEAIDYRLHPDVLEFANQMLSSPDAYYNKTFQGEELRVWREFRKKTNQLPDPKLDETNSSHYYFYSIGSGALGVTTYAPLNEEQIGLFKRFRNVFELAYRRFIDIEKALAQAREAQIEAALERVRAKSMAMHHSDDLITVINVVQEQLLGLGFHFHGANFVTDYSEKGYTMWLASPGESFPYKIYVPQVGLKYFEAVNAAIEKGLDFATYTLSFEEKNIYFKNLFENSLIRNTSEEGKRIVFESKGMAASVVLLDKIRLNLMNLDVIPYTDEENDILKRFGYVFEQSYTRFLDLQKAEAQAREAQIEAGLERVRSKTMAMHQSEEVTGVAVSLNEELLKLGFEGGSTIIIMDNETGGMEQWTGFSEDKSLKSCYVPYFKHPCHDAQLNTWKKGEEFLVYTLAGDEKRSLDEHYFATGYKVFPESDKRWMRQMESVTFSHAFMKYGAIHWGPGQLTEDQLRILQRFSKVFEQSYTRFLDLQKAEAQAREAQIEAALERVRSRTMGMHKSDELREVVAVLFTQLQHIGFDIKFCSIALIDKINSTVEFWLSGFSQEILPESYHVPNLEHPFYQNFQSTFRQGVPYHVFELAGAEKRSYDKLWFTLTDFKNLPEPVKRPMMEMERVVLSCAFTKNGMIQIGGFEPLSETDAMIIQRFAKVFEQTYTRFLDLQKAEAQAREAQTEAALERVRSRTMGMHKSDELLDVVAVVFQQMQLLGFNINLCNIVLFDRNTLQADYWVSTNEQAILPESYHIPYFDHPFYQFQLNSWKNAEPLTIFNLEGETKIRWDEILFTQTDLKRFPASLKKMMKELEKIIISSVATKHGLLQVIGHEPLSNEYAALLGRFAKVFEQTYTRFLDLQKAEAQAREAQIEVALERIRARAMAMHSSNELMDVANILREQMGLLGQPDLETSVVNLFEEDSELIFSWNASRVPGSSEKIISSTTSFLKNSSELTREMMSLYHSGEKEYTLEAAGFKLMEFLEVLIKANPQVADYIGNNPPEKVFYHFTTFTGGNLLTVSYQPPSEETKSLQRRAASVFDMAYRRYRDLKRAEAQAREAKIEAALERVRSRTMAMHKSDELAEVATVLFEQMSLLDNTPERFNIRIANEAEGVFEFWATDQEGHLVNKFFRAAFDRSPVVLQMYTSWKAKEKILIQDLHGDQLSEWVHYIKDELGVPFNTKTLKEHRFLSSVFFSHGMIGITTNDIPSPATLQLIERFAKVFEQTYTRFLDLQKAEAQTKEARIEVALERVRAKAMAMHKSDDLKPAVATVFEELDKLNIGILRCGIAIMDKEKPRADVWITVKSEQTNTIQVSGDESLDYHPLLRGAYDGWVKQEDFSYVLQGEDLLSYYRDVASITYQLPVSSPFDKEKKDQQQYYFNAVFQDGSLFAFMETAFTDEAKTVMKRFANVFNLTYKRFLDLQKAEAQAREAQIELGLERVRARAMAMQKSAELKDLIATVSTELSKLDIVLDRSVIMTYDIKTLGMTWWMANPETSSDPIGLYIKYHEQPPYLAFLKAWQDRAVKWQYLLEGPVKRTWDEFLFVETDLSRLPRFVIDNMRGNDKVYLSASFNNFGCLTLATLEPLSDEQFDIMLRFAKVFDLTYTRFNDLKQAEAQAREARIEAALEKVRASTMAMQRSEDLSQTAFVLFNQFKELGEAPERIFIATFDDHDSGVIDLWGTDQGGNQLNKLFKLPVNEPTMVSKIIAAWKEKKKSVVVDLKGEELKTYLGFLKQAGIPVTDGVMTDRRVQTAACFSNGVIGVTTPEPQSAESVQLQERFAGVFDLTYTRFLDLQKAEEQAHKAQIETALERVRARALAMQEPEELKDVAQVLRTEMGLLGVEELETCSIYINDESAEKAECWYALKDIRSEDKKLVNDHFALNLVDTWVGREMLRFYQSPQKQISIVMQGENRKEWIRYCEEHSAPFRGYYGETIPDRTYHLYKFSHGAIGAAAAGDISEESWRMLSRAASVFTLAYSRFKDLTQARTDLIKLKEEKKRAEEALTELQATQKQLIQSEKMASLGELTAGIAHEIQNPLNFVNNFSDVSNELLEEMKQELATGNTQQAIEIVNGVKENLEKILHHGKRADAIVKGMLQHSRSSSGQKELTDINTLAEEYLRLAYHGLRAKDKFFNAKFETDLDPSLDKINVVPQEIGRVILNLINNSFYAVTEKKRSRGNGYEPSVIVSTKKIKDKVEIRVKDNGNGIPQKVLDKIFQPFFTTKPTGQGTGLGLSLSYDIITKGHDGEIKVNTKENEGTEFTIVLPA